MIAEDTARNSSLQRGAKVYLCGRIWRPEWSEIPVIGLTRGKRYQVIDVPMNLIENVRKSRAYNPAVLEIMNNWEFLECWWNDKEEDKQDVERFVAEWNGAEAVN